MSEPILIWGAGAIGGNLAIALNQFKDRKSVV